MKLSISNKADVRKNNSSWYMFFLTLTFHLQPLFVFVKKFRLRCLIDTAWKKRPHSELFWSAFSRIRTEFGEVRSISPYSAQMLEDVDQIDSEYGHFLRSESSEYASKQLWNSVMVFFDENSASNVRITTSWSNIIIFAQHSKNSNVWKQIW